MWLVFCDIFYACRKQSSPIIIQCFTKLIFQIISWFVMCVKQYQYLFHQHCFDISNVLILFSSDFSFYIERDIEKLMIPPASIHLLKLPKLFMKEKKQFCYCKEKKITFSYHIRSLNSFLKLTWQCKVLQTKLHLLCNNCLYILFPTCQHVFHQKESKNINYHNNYKWINK